MDSTKTTKPIILFDGLCNFCSSIVQFAILRDPKGVFKFASLQSSIGNNLLKRFGLSIDDYDTFVLIENDEYFLRSSATLRLFKRLNGLWPLLYIFIVIPRPLRDYVYSIVAKNRYSWFGKRKECFIPTPEIESRFL
ncbi:thiol-disulfide oxidoreductase DCC family protein [Desulfobacterota bacterium AH_259_B03_O07]|nr:thiol-disulfide oxidoreductase DCC family protein [Desulfobacterota bacterium AH_259_B03_O07]